MSGCQEVEKRGGWHDTIGNRAGVTRFLKRDICDDIIEC
jgi:hypothetical protein